MAPGIISSAKPLVIHGPSVFIMIGGYVLWSIDPPEIGNFGCFKIVLLVILLPVSLIK